MNLEKYNRYKLSFTYAYFDDVNEVLKGYNIIQQRFSSDTTLIVELPKNDEQFILYKLMLITFKQIKITLITNPKDDYSSEDVGTDKPLGSKSAIDEN